MRILHISTRLILGGSQENTVLSCEEQARRGHEVHLAFGPIYGPEGSLLARVRSFRTPDGRSIATHIVPHLVREISPISDWKCVAELKTLIGGLGPDVVHTHSSKAGILGRRAAWCVLTSPKRQRGMDHASLAPGIVHTVHGPPFMPIEGGLFQRARVRLLNLAYTLAERRAASHCHRIVSVADAMTREFLRRDIGSAGQYVTVRSGMELKPFLEPAPGESREDSRRALGLAPDDFVVGTVARLAQHKGHDDLLEALGEDLKKRPTWRLLWVGDGWWRERLITRARGMGLGVAELDGEPTHNAQRTTHNANPAACQILLTGLVPTERIPALVRAMDVLAHPSYREGLPRTVPQALLCGVCPVAYDVDGTGEACIDLKTGRLVPLADRAALRDAVRWCAENPRRREELALAGRAMCEREFSVRAMVDGLERVYAEAFALARGVA